MQPILIVAEQDALVEPLGSLLHTRPGRLRPGLLVASASQVTL
jgi:hypothetical protein